MNQKNIYILFFIYLIINVYGTLIDDEEEELNFSSENEYNQMVMTATSAAGTAAVKTIPTQYITTTTTVPSSLKVLPTEALKMKETYILFQHNNTFLNLETALPDNIDGVYVTCLNYDNRDYENEKEKLDLPYVCYDDDCYEAYDTHFNQTYFKPFGPTTTADCRLYTSKEGLPSPTTSINVLTKPVCIPTYASKRTTSQILSTVTEIHDESNTDYITRITTRLSSIYTYTSYFSTTCAYKNKKSSTTTTTTATPTTTIKTYGEDPVSTNVNSGTKTVTMGPRTVYSITIPERIKDYAYTCTKYISGVKHNGPPTTQFVKNIYATTTTTRPPKAIGETVTFTRPPKTIPTFTKPPNTIPTTRITGKVLNTPFTARDSTSTTTTTTTTTTNFTGKYLPVYTPVVDRVPLSDLYMDNISYYCEDDTFCLKRYATYRTSRSLNVQQTSYLACNVYTPFEKPTPTHSDVSIKTMSLCRPTTIVKHSTTPITFKTIYTTIIGESQIATYVTGYLTYITYDAVVTSCNTLKPTDTIMSMTTPMTIPMTTTLTTTTIPTTTTPPTTTAPPKPSTKFVCSVVTVTERQKVTVTKKEQVTVTVTEYDEPTTAVEEHCSSQWEQCGGVNYNGPTCCQSGYTCHYVSPYFSHCI